MTLADAIEAFDTASADARAALDEYAVGGDPRQLVDALHDLELRSCQLRLAAQIEHGERVGQRT
jgi:hypothetical protein